MELSTIGYEGADLDDFIITLKSAGITDLVDVRERAQSRRKGFSKTALSNSLHEANIRYLHLKELGDPKEGRTAARSGDVSRFRRIYSAVLEGELARLAIGAIVKLAQEGHPCMLCYERNPNQCHRKMIADRIEELHPIATIHLGVQAGAQHNRSARSMRDPNQSEAT